MFKPNSKRHLYTLIHTIVIVLLISLLPVLSYSHDCDNHENELSVNACVVCLTSNIYIQTQSNLVTNTLFILNEKVLCEYNLLSLLLDIQEINKGPPV